MIKKTDFYEDIYEIINAANRILENANKEAEDELCINGKASVKNSITLNENSCIAEGELVLTDHGLIPIQYVTKDDKVWDGSLWVNHDGVIYKGEREVITYDGLTATPDHPVYIDEQENPIELGAAAACKKHILQTGAGERAIWHALNFNAGETDISTPTFRYASVYDIMNAGPRHRFTVSGKLVHNCSCSCTDAYTSHSNK